MIDLSSDSHLVDQPAIPHRSALTSPWEGTRVHGRGCGCPPAVRSGRVYVVLRVVGADGGASLKRTDRTVSLSGSDAAVFPVRLSGC